MEEQSRSTADGKAVLIMLDDKCASPCYCFGTNGHATRVMSPEIVDAVLEWLPGLDSAPLSVLYMVGDPQGLDEDVRKILREASGSVICGPMHRAEQQAAGLPWSHTQVVVFPSLAAFDDAGVVVEGRSGVVHVGRNEVARLSDVVMAKSKSIGDQSRLRLRARDLHLWQESHLRTYALEVTRLMEHELRLNAAGVPTVWDLWPSGRCPARSSMITIGPDGLCYPCPAFYHAGQTGRLGAREGLTGEHVFLRELDRVCSVCRSEQCEACLFWESGLVGGKVGPCQFRVDRDRAKETTVHMSDRSGYLFEGLQAQTAENIVSRHNPEGVGKGSVWAAEQVDDMTCEEFVLILRSIHQLTEALTGGAAGTPQDILSRYEGFGGFPPQTREELFSYGRFAGIIEDMYQEDSSADERAARPATDGPISPSPLPEGEVPVASRRWLCLRMAHSILATLVALRDEIQSGKWPVEPPLPGGKKEVDEVPEQGARRLPLSEEQATVIQRLYESVLGWDLICRDAEDGLRCGFEAKSVLEYARKRREEVLREQDAWFSRTALQNGWEAPEGYAWNVDFEHNIKVSTAYCRPVVGPVAGQGEWVPLLPLGGLEKEVFDRLRCLLETSLATAKQHLLGHLAGAENGERDLARVVGTVGEHALDLRRWFHGIAKEHGWAPALEWRVNHQTGWVDGRLVPQTLLS